MTSTRIIADLDAAAALRAAGYEVTVTTGSRAAFVIPNTLEVNAYITLLREGRLPGISAFLKARGELRRQIAHARQRAAAGTGDTGPQGDQEDAGRGGET